MTVLRGVVDRAGRPGSFVLTGSALPSLMTQAGETLAGRIGSSELAGMPSRPALRWFRGGFPPLYGIKAAGLKTAQPVGPGAFMIRIRDTGLLHPLAGLREPRDLETWPGRGRS